MLKQGLMTTVGESIEDIPVQEIADVQVECQAEWLDTAVGSRTILIVVGSQSGEERCWWGVPSYAHDQGFQGRKFQGGTEYVVDSCAKGQSSFHRTERRRHRPQIQAA